jgi:hypothetical protein
MTEDTKDVFRGSLWFGAYWGLASTVLKLVFTDAFSLSRSTAFSLAILITSLCAYPIFNRRPRARWKFLFLNVERFGLWHHVAMSIVFAAAAYLIARPLGW